MPNLYTEQEVLDFWDSHATDEQKEERAEIERLEKNIEVARKYMRDALARYRKDKARTRSKAKADNPWVDLEPYTNREQIRDDYGWEIISEKEMDRLMNLWDLREASKSKTTLEDTVTEIIQAAINKASEPYFEKIQAFHDKRSKMRKEAKRVAVENWNNAK